MAGAKMSGAVIDGAPKRLLPTANGSAQMSRTDQLNVPATRVMEGNGETVAYVKTQELMMTIQYTPYTNNLRITDYRRQDENTGFKLSHSPRYITLGNAQHINNILKQ